MSTPIGIIGLNEFLKILTFAPHNSTKELDVETKTAKTVTMLKTKTITTDKATLLVVELPEGSHPVHVCKHIRDSIHYLLYDGATNTAYKEFLPDGNWQLLGRLPDITEEQADKVVDRSRLFSDLYKSYNSDDVRPYSFAKESFNSLLQANEVCFENPLGECPERINGGVGGISRKLYEESKKTIDDWQEAESKVWDKERTYLFIKVD